MISSDYNKLLQEAQKNKFYPVYILMGEESYFIDNLSKEIQKNALDETARGFDETILYGNDTNINQIASVAKRFPAIGKHHLVIIREAQSIKNIEKLEGLLEGDLSHLILIISYKGKKIDKRKRFLKLAIEKGVVFESKRIYDNQVPTWVNNFLKEKGKTIDPKSIALLLEFLGANLSKISNELEKLISSINKDNITSEDISKFIGISNEYNIFELQKSIGSRNISKIFKIINKFGEDPKNHPATLTISMLYNYFQKILIYHTEQNKNPQSIASKLGVNPFFVTDYQIASTNYNIKQCVNAIEYISNTDAKLKGFKSPTIKDKELMTALLFKILN